MDKIFTKIYLAAPAETNWIPNETKWIDDKSMWIDLEEMKLMLV